jgi:hypothetical protein
MHKRIGAVVRSGATDKPNTANQRDRLSVMSISFHRDANSFHQMSISFHRDANSFHGILFHEFVSVPSGCAHTDMKPPVR